MLQPKQILLGDGGGREQLALPLADNRAGAAEHRIIRYMALRPLTQAGRISRLHHLVYVAFDLSHELTHIPIAELLRLTLLRLLLRLLLLLLRWLLRKGESVQHQNGRGGSRNDCWERFHLHGSSERR